jgi:hypothetical protein
MNMATHKREYTIRAVGKTLGIVLSIAFILLLAYLIGAHP